MRGIKIRFTDISQFASSFGGRCAEGFALRHIGQLLYQCRSWEEYKNILPNAGARQNPVDVIRPHIPSRADTDTFHYDDLALDRMQESMRQLLVSERAIAALELSEKDAHISEPLLPVLRQLLSDARLPVPFHLAYGMERLLSTYKAFLWQGTLVTKQNCRILALRFAKEMHGSISEAVSALEEIRNAGDHTASILCLLIKLQADLTKLDAYTREQRFDLYYRSPWVAGCHVTEILDNAFYDGVWLYCELGYVCAVLHLYNALRHLDPPIRKITVLEQLCQFFLQPLFLGTVPKENFSSHFRRAMGQGLNRENGFSTDRRSGLSMPSNVSSRKVDRESMSLFYTLASLNYQPTIDFWARVYIDPTLKQPSHGQAARVEQEVHSVPFNDPLDKIKTAVIKEFTGELPVIRANLFAIFCFCTRILHDVSKIVNKDPGIFSQGMPGASLGFYMVDAILEDIVDHLRDDSKRHWLRYLRTLNMAKEVFAQVNNVPSLSNYQWSI